MAEFQQRWRILRRWRHHLLGWLQRAAVLAVLAGLVWWRWGLAGWAVAGGIALAGGLIVWAVVMPARLAPPVPTETLDKITDPKVRLEVSDARTRLRHDLRNGALQLLTVLAVLLGAGLGFQQLAEDRDQARQDRQLTRQGQASERFTRAIDQLGSSRVETRIGGIYGLNQITEQAPENTGPVGEVLLAWLNGQTRPRTLPETTLREHAPDVQAALSVLTGQQRYSSIIANRLQLHKLGLRGATLGSATLTGADLRRADLSDADLRRANLRRANLDGANLHGADLTEADLLGVDLRRANLRDATLAGADLRAVNLSGADLTEADLFGVDLNLAVLRDAILVRADLAEADLGADLSGADLRLAGLSVGTNLRGAILFGADLRDTQLDLADLRGARGDKNTRWPPGFNWRRAGAEVQP